MSTNEWITDRLPNKEDGIHGFCVVYNALGRLVYIGEIKQGEAWKLIPECEPYVKPKRYTVKWLNDMNCWAIMQAHFIATRLIQLDCECQEHREAAEEIAAIYERMKP
ncbi:hypothetical protein UFOVP418_56 [uncultured Caudovirales phage]|uniref:Uncharacterized protein n=1 Tax=uncultured Caudovirales phage TaxID=2100421 RepID=A0A6J5M421_9CAUD|nr:hypothetical protein UFOVP418_56 [uncultured Caudovirales phage]